MNPHQTLGIEPNASEEDIKKAYRKLAMELHPDRTGGDPEAEKKFKEVQSAYESLTSNKGNGNGGFDPFSMFKDIFGQQSPFGNPFGKQKKMRGDDIVVPREFDFWKVAQGCKEEIEFRRSKPCDVCSGTGGNRRTCPICHGDGMTSMRQGNMHIRTTCNRCGGNGNIIDNPCKDCNGGKKLENMKLVVDLPAGAREGDHLKMVGCGEIIADGPPGDAFLIVKIRPDPVFARNDNDLIINIPITFSQAVLGGEVQVPGLKELHTITIPPGAKEGHAIKIEGAGFSRGGVGSLVVVCHIDTSANDEETIKLVKKMKNIEQKNPSPTIKEFNEFVNEHQPL